LNWCFDPSSELLGYSRSSASADSSLPDGRQLSSLESFASRGKGFGIDAFNLPASKFFKPSLGFRKPQSSGITFNFVIESRHETPSQLHAVPQREFHYIGRRLIQIGTHVVRISPHYRTVKISGRRSGRLKIAQALKPGIWIINKKRELALAGDRFGVR
jgi:hypothetical protein